MAVTPDVPPMVQAEEPVPVIAHVCALEDASMVPELATLVLAKLQPAVSVPEPAAASDRRASVSRTRRLHAGRQVAAVAAAAMPAPGRAKARHQRRNAPLSVEASTRLPRKTSRRKKKNQNQHQMKMRMRSESALRTGARAYTYVCGRDALCLVWVAVRPRRARLRRSAARTPPAPVATGLPAVRLQRFHRVQLVSYIIFTTYIDYIR